MLAVLPAAIGLPYFAFWLWQDELAPRVRDYIERQQYRAAEAARADGYRRAAGTLARDLATGRIAAGTPAAEVTARFPPVRVHPYRRFNRLLYRDGEAWVELWALDGRLVQAIRFPEPEGRRIDRRDWFIDEFFVMSPADRAVQSAELLAHAAAYRDTGMALAGPTAYISLHDRHTLR